MPHQTIHPHQLRRAPKVPPRFAGWVGAAYQAHIERIQVLHPDLDIIGSFARVGEHDLAALVLKAIDTLVSEARAPRHPAWDCREPFSYEGKANPTTADKTKCLGVWTDGVSLLIEEEPEDRKKGFRPAYRFQKGRRYRITIEELPK